MLRDPLVKGYSVNAKRLKELKQSLKLIGQVLGQYDVTSDQARAFLHVVTGYATGMADGINITSLRWTAAVAVLLCAASAAAQRPARSGPASGAAREKPYPTQGKCPQDFLMAAKARDTGMPVGNTGAGAN